MKLRNKKTGEIVEPFGISYANGRTFVQFDDEKGNLKLEAHSLAELNAEWEDYEEPKDFWYIGVECGVMCDSTDPDLQDKRYPMEFMKAIGNYFETKEEAEKAVEKLKAWKRLKDNGFVFTGWDRHPDFPGDFRITASDEYTCDDKDLDLLFGGEE